MKKKTELKKVDPKNRPRPLTFIFLLIAGLAVFCFYPRVSANPRLLASFAAAVFVLLVFFFLLRRRVAREKRRLYYEFVPNKVHYVQLVMQLCIFIYWGWYWRPVFPFAAMIAAQLLFAYALDMLITWSRQEKWTLGFGPMPIVLSTNLF